MIRAASANPFLKALNKSNGCPATPNCQAVRLGRTAVHLAAVGVVRLGDAAGDEMPRVDGHRAGGAVVECASVTGPAVVKGSRSQGQGPWLAGHRRAKDRKGVYASPVRGHREELCTLAPQATLADDAQYVLLLDEAEARKPLRSRHLDNLAWTEHGSFDPPAREGQTGGSA